MVPKPQLWGCQCRQIDLRSLQVGHARAGGKARLGVYVLTKAGRVIVVGSCKRCGSSTLSTTPVKLGGSRRTQRRSCPTRADRRVLIPELASGRPWIESKLKILKVWGANYAAQRGQGVDGAPGTFERGTAHLANRYSIRCTCTQSGKCKRIRRSGDHRAGKRNLSQGSVHHLVGSRSGRIPGHRTRGLSGRCNG